MLSTSQDRRVMLKYIVIIFLSEGLIDSIKHFFITRLNRLRTELYIDFKNQLFKDFLSRTKITKKIQFDDEGNEEEKLALRSAYKFYPGQLIDRVFDPETSMAMCGNLLVLPQACLVLRNLEDILSKHTFTTNQQILIGFSLVTVGLILRYFLKIVLL